MVGWTYETIKIKLTSHILLFRWYRIYWQWFQAMWWKSDARAWGRGGGACPIKESRKRVFKCIAISTWQKTRCCAILRGEEHGNATDGHQWNKENVLYEGEDANQSECEGYYRCCLYKRSEPGKAKLFRVTPCLELNKEYTEECLLRWKSSVLETSSIGSML